MAEADFLDLAAISEAPRSGGPPFAVLDLL